MPPTKFLKFYDKKWTFVVYDLKEPITADASDISSTSESRQNVQSLLQSRNNFQISPFHPSSAVRHSPGFGGSSPKHSKSYKSVDVHLSGRSSFIPSSGALEVVWCSVIIALEQRCLDSRGRCD